MKHFLLLIIISCIIVPVQAQDVEEIIAGSVAQAMTERMDDIGNAVKKGLSIPDPSYPNFTVQAGISRVHGEFIRGKACLGGAGGFVLYGGVGRDWIFNPKTMNTLDRMERALYGMRVWDIILVVTMGNSTLRWIMHEPRW